MTPLIITEQAVKDDISTVYCYYVNPVFNETCNYFEKCEFYTTFNGDYANGKEREFIADFDAKNPGMFSGYHISYESCN